MGPTTTQRSTAQTAVRARACTTSYGRARWTRGFSDGGGGHSINGQALAVKACGASQGRAQRAGCAFGMACAQFKSEGTAARLDAKKMSSSRGTSRVASATPGSCSCIGRMTSTGLSERFDARVPSARHAREESYSRVIIADSICATRVIVPADQGRRVEEPFESPAARLPDVRGACRRRARSDRRSVAAGMAERRVTRHRLAAADAHHCSMPRALSRPRSSSTPASVELGTWNIGTCRN